jgi:DNA-binding CsgD family transcriptional regulator
MAMPDKVALDLQQRLATLRGHTTALDERRRATLEAMRQSMARIRQLGDGLLRLRYPPPVLLNHNGDHGAFALAQQYGLSQRELEVALLLAEGRSNVEIATAVKVSTHTARHHTQHVLGKLGVRSRARAAAVINDILAATNGGSREIHHFPTKVLRASPKDPQS